MEGKSLYQLTEEVVAIFKEYDKQGTNPWTYQTAVADLPYQLGSLVKAVQQMRGDRYADGKTPEQLKNTVADELSDIMAELLFIAQDLDINLYDAWNKMLKSDATKIETRTTSK